MKPLHRRIRMLSGLAAIRCKHGYTQEGFAQLLGIPRSTLSMAESRQRLLPLSALIKLSEFEKDMAAQNQQEAPAVSP